VPAGPNVASGMKSRGSIFPYLLMLTLSVHSIITGIALGLEDHLMSAVAIFLAVMAHKFTAAMALAISFSREAIELKRSRALLGVFYVMTPIGIILGTWWSSLLSGQGEAMIEGIFDALAAGTFIYISVVDILSEEFSANEARWGLFLMTVLGFAVMALVAI
jgi:zinc transporter 1/2/3